MSDKPKAGFGLDIDPNEFAPRNVGFTSREPKRRSRSTTGRNVQLNLKATPEVVSQFNSIADANDWSLAETFEQALAALQQKLG